MDKFLYPYRKPYKSYQLKVDNLHKLKIQKYGNPKGIPLIFLHGGPGAPTDQYCSRFFDKRYYNIVLFDQRGCGQSTPLGELKNNDTSHLINDIDKIRLDCNFKKMVLFGGSWGASLAILYALSYPQNIIAYIIRDICLMNSPIFTESFKNMYPEYWNNFLRLGKSNNIYDVMDLYYDQIKKKNKKFINNWFNLEFKSLTVHPDDNLLINNETINLKYISSLLECHYYKNNFFIPNNYIKDNCYKLKNIPGHIIHGRLDVICNPKDSFELNSWLTKSKLFIIESAGHSYLDPPLTKQLIESTKLFADLYFKNRGLYYL